MQTIVSQLESAFRSAIVAALGFEADPLVAPAQNEKFGDYQSNAAMGLARQVTERTGQKANPRQIAEQIIAKLDLGEMSSEVSIAGPGFINVRLDPRWLAQRLVGALPDARLGLPLSASPIRTVVDYSGPNIAKEMHVGHLRSTIIGDAIARTLRFLYGQENVIPQNHIGDWGTQFGMLITYLATQGYSTATGWPEIEDLESFYRRAKQEFDESPAFQEAARDMVVLLQKGDPAPRRAWQYIVDVTRQHYQQVYDELGVLLEREHERGESFYNPFLPDVVRELKEKSIAVESEGAVVVKVPGYESPLIIQKSDGGYLYGTTDLAAIRYRVFELHARRIIYTHDSRQAQHFAQVFWTAQQAGWAEGVWLEYAPFGTMLGEDGKPFKTRTGGTVKLKDLLDEAEQRAFTLVTEKNPDLAEGQRRRIAHAVGVGAIKYADLSKDRISDYVFSWDKMLAFDGNTAPYLQNAYVRVHGIFRKASAAGIDPKEAVRQAEVRLDSPFELALAKHILRIGEVTELVARELKPHHLCNYLYELATRYHAFFENCPVLQSEEPTRSSRLALCDATARTLALGLDLLGIEHPEQM